MDITQKEAGTVLRHPGTYRTGCRGVILVLAFLHIWIWIMPAAAQDSEKEETEEEEIQSIKERRKETLQYGTDEAVMGVVEQLKKDRNEDLNPRLLEILEETINPKVSIGILNFFRTLETDSALPQARKILERAEEMEKPAQYNLLAAAIDYIAELEDRESEPMIRELITYREDRICRNAIEAAGAVGGEETAQVLMDVVDDPSTEDSLKEKAILSLGTIGHQPASELLRGIAGDEDQGKALRWYACHALGKLRDTESLPVLKGIFSEEDPILKSYAVLAISYFEGEEPQRILRQALRDNSARVRSAAAEGLGRREDPGAIDFLDYIVRRDSDESVKKKALKALADIGGKGLDILSETAVEGENYALREYAFQLLSKENPKKAADAAGTIMEEEWSKDESWMLDHIGRILYRQGSREYSAIYSRFLDHPWYIIRIYGIRGIGKAGISGKKNRIAELAEDKSQPGNLRSEAKAVLEDL